MLIKRLHVTETDRKRLHHKGEVKDMETKKWWESKTIWFNVIMTILDIAALQSVSAWLDIQTLALIQTVGNVILRVWFSDTIIEKKVI